MVYNGKFMVYFIENPIKMNDLGVPSHLWKPAYMVEQRKNMPLTSPQHSEPVSSTCGTLS